MREIDGWVGCYKVRGFDWIDGKHYYMNVMYYKPGSRLSSLPAVERSVLIPKTEKQMNIIDNWIHTVVEAIIRTPELPRKGREIPIVTFGS